MELRVWLQSTAATAKRRPPYVHVAAAVTRDLINDQPVQPHAVLADAAANGLDNTCTASVTSCTMASNRFGQILNPRAARGAAGSQIVLVS